MQGIEKITLSRKAKCKSLLGMCDVPDFKQGDIAYRTSIGFMHAEGDCGSMNSKFYEAQGEPNGGNLCQVYGRVEINYRPGILTRVLNSTINKYQELVGKDDCPEDDPNC